MEAITLLKRMACVTKSNQVTLVCALSTCGHTCMLHLGKCIHSYIFRYGIEPGSFISNALVDMYGKCASLVKARRVFNNTPNKNLTSWNSMINCYTLHGQSQAAISVFQELLQNRDDVNGITFVGLLNACTHGGLLEQGKLYFNTMIKDYGIELEIEHCSCLVDLLGRAGRFEEALDVMRKMSMQADEIVWGYFLNACKIHGRRDLGEFAAKKLVEIYISKINPDAWPAIAADVVAGEQRIIALEFGYTRLFHPDKPVTKAQTAISLATSEASEIVNEELARIEVEALAENAVTVHNALVAEVERDINATFEKELLLERQKIDAMDKMAEEARLNWRG
ncbi:pentatricopeptide repeat-containing protein At1g33350-like [Impatiens glandulifera]|uniref:pentatricopeptide repeat-containing protein At1g33350-like n=1 Tax=Impatiens glandulifera TaxID=253017 RepID=UPI001FB0E7AB|nr:pentatricopeptide repeat-containing protein At1g33350-like [Impatiens glandulifera]